MVSVSLGDFSNTQLTSAELSIAPDRNSILVPSHIKTQLRQNGLDIDNFTPMAKDEMMARLD